jgi:ribonuclease HI
MNTNKIYPTTEYTMFFDGCSKNNPGEAGIGVVVYNSNYEEIAIVSQSIGIRSNNEAEYIALIEGLKTLVIRGIKSVTVFGDSQLVIKQVTKEYKVKSEKLIPLYNKTQELLKQFEYIEFNHILRNKNKRADQLANIALSNKILIM